PRRLPPPRSTLFPYTTLFRSSVRDEGWLRALTILFVASGALAALYGLATPSTDPTLAVGKTRVNGPEGENYNTLCGYLVLCIAADRKSTRLNSSHVSISYAVF